MDFKLHSQFRPTGDQPQAIEALTRGLNMGLSDQVLLGVTGSGKTFTMANIIANVNRPTLVLAHNKTLAAQLCSEFREFSRKTQSSISFPIMIITSLRRTSPRRIPILKKTPPSTTRSSVCATARQARCLSAGT